MQFRLWSLFVVTTIVAFFCAAEAAKRAEDRALARAVDQFNTLCDDGKFEEARSFANRTAERFPQNPLAVQLYWTARMLDRTRIIDVGLVFECYGLEDIDD
jgi:hypothetical protein